MEQSCAAATRRLGLPNPTLTTTILFTLYLLSLLAPVRAYKNYTVGDSLGWYDTTEKPNVDYQKWAAKKTFSLGDFLIFNTNNNHSVIQTYNETTFKSCDYADSLDKDTTQWSTDDPSNTSPHAVSVPVPLLKTGPTYFFSGDYDGDQCRNGLQFSINVTYGQGLPKSLRIPSEEAPAPVNQVSGDEEAAPDTIVPASFNHPKDIGDDNDTDSNETSDSTSLSSFSIFFGAQLHGIFFIFLGLSCILL